MGLNIPKIFSSVNFGGGQTTTGLRIINGLQKHLSGEASGAPAPPSMTRLESMFQGAFKARAEHYATGVPVSILGLVKETSLC
jgi:hypothetical protein